MAHKDNRATTLALFLLAGVALTINIASSTPVGSQGDMAQDRAALFPPSMVTSVLYNQIDSASGSSAPAQDFEPSFDTFDCEGADDFLVEGSSGWSVDQVYIQGTYSPAGGPADSVKVTFYPDDSGFPAATPVAGCAYSGISPVDSSGSFQIPLVPACSLSPGAYWLAIQTRMDFDPLGQHYWANRSVQSNNESVWRNPGDGFATGCTAWGRQTSCGVGGGISPDFLFQILGDLVATLIFEDGFESGTTTQWSQTVLL